MTEPLWRRHTFSPEEDKERVRGLLAKANMRADEIEEELEWTPYRVLNALRALIDDGLVDYKTPPHRVRTTGAGCRITRPKQYRLVGGGVQDA